MAKPKNGKAKRTYKEQVQVQAIRHEQVKAQQRKSSTRFNRWVFGLLALLFMASAGFAVAESRAVQAARVSDQARSIDDEDVDPATWRDLELVMTNADGGKTEIGLLRPAWWVEQVGAEEGKTIDLNIPEMKMQGPTKVLSNKPMKPGPVHGAGTVTGTFKHTASDILNLQLQGEKQPIGVTPTHPFRSADRKAWVSVSQLKVGERVVTRNGTTKVVSISHRAGSEPVYNLEVHKTHTYFVGTTGGGAWVHNACPGEILKNLRAPEEFSTAASSEAEAVAWAREAFPNAMELPKAIEGQPYPKAPPGVKDWFQVQPAEPNVGNMQPHVKYEIWSGGKKGRGGSWGHIWFGE